MPRDTTSLYDVFLSHSHDDAETVANIAPKAIDCFEKAVQIMKTNFDEQDSTFLLFKSNLEKAILRRDQPPTHEGKPIL